MTWLKLHSTSRTEISSTEYLVESTPITDVCHKRLSKQYRQADDLRKLFTGNSKNRYINRWITLQNIQLTSSQMTASQDIVFLNTDVDICFVEMCLEDMHVYDTWNIGYIHLP